MSLGEYLLRMLRELKPMITAFSVVVVLTLVMLFFFRVQIKKVWFSDRLFPTVGLFFGLRTSGVVRLACSWIRLIFVLVFTCCFSKLYPVQYCSLLLVGFVGAACAYKWKNKLVSLFWSILQVAALFSANVICGYYWDLIGGPELVAVYVAMGIFVILFSLYLFYSEIGDISESRAVNASYVWESQK